MLRVLLLGGTTEASRMAEALSAAGHWAVFSYAGRTLAPLRQPLPTRIGGFGGVEGLVAFLKHERISHVIDATHPFAAAMRHNACVACAETGAALIRLERTAWQPDAGCDWSTVESVEAAAAALPDRPARVFLAIGRQHVSVFAVKPQHHYLLRLVDAPEGPPLLPDVHVEVARGPFTVAGDVEMLRRRSIGLVVARNSGGAGAEAKLHAARALRLPVIMIARPGMADQPGMPTRLVVDSQHAVMEWLAHPTRLGV